MAHYQDGNPAYYGHQHQHQGSRHERTSSFNSGDDAALFSSPQSYNAGARARNSGRYPLHPSIDSGSLYPGGHDDDLMSLYAQLSSSDTASSGPSSSNVVYPTSPTQPTYNPQQFASQAPPPQQLPTYNPLAYPASISTSRFQNQSTYNPAAYQAASSLSYGSPNAPRRSSAASQYGYTPTTPQSHYSTPSEHLYGGMSPQSATSSGYPAYISQSPRHTEFVNAPLDIQPPEPPAHLTQSNDPYGVLHSGDYTRTARSMARRPTGPDAPGRTDTLNRHPQSRPLPGPPIEAMDPPLQETLIPAGQQPDSDELIGELEAAVSDETHPNGNMATDTGDYVDYDAYSDNSDAEAAAGLEMLRMAEEEDRRQTTRRSTQGSNDEQIAAELGLYEGGLDAHAYYENGSDMGRNADLATDGSFRSSDWSAAEPREPYANGYDHNSAVPWDSPHQSQQFHDARVDAGGTGGLAEPDEMDRRMSFDYGDEMDGPLATPEPPYRSDSDSTDKDEFGEPGDMFFHPGMRPLPPEPVERSNNLDVIPHLMPAGTYRNQEQDHEFTQYPHHHQDHHQHDLYPLSADSLGQGALSAPPVPRSTSLTSHPIGPRADPPIRSKTDADREKYRAQQELSQQANPVTLDLPVIPAGRRKRFNPAKLSSEQFKKCTEPWAISAVSAWVRELSEDEVDLRKSTVANALVALFTHKVPTMNVADAETLADKVVSDMLEEQVLVKEEEWVKFGPGTISGVLFQITGRGCYSPLLHEQQGNEPFGRCYSHHCMRTLKKVNLETQMLEMQKAEDWREFYNVPKEALGSYHKKEIDRQYNLHEIVTTEDGYIRQLDVLRQLYRDPLATTQPPVIPPKRLDKFLRDVFGKVDAVKQVNEDFLLAQLKYRQKEQGPFIVGFSDIFREWIRKAKAAYITYAATFPNANYMVRREAERNLRFREFLEEVRDNKLSNRLGWDTYLKAPITRIQRYTLLLATVHKNMLKDSEEKANVAQAIQEIKIVALDCDHKVGEMTKKVDLLELSHKLQLRPEMKKEVELNLEHLGREIIFRGHLQRPGTRTRFNLVDTHAILFDHYLVLAKESTVRDQSKSAKYTTFDVSKLPIPMDLLVLESTNDDPVVKSAVRGVATVAPPPAARNAGPNPILHSSSSNSTSSTNSSSSAKTLVPTTVLDNSKDDKILYPFKIKHLGKSPSYTLYAFSAQNRRDWCEKIIEAKTKHAAALFAQNSEPFRLRVLADTAFGYSENQPPKSVIIAGTPIHRAIKEMEDRYPDSSDAFTRPLPICKTPVHCSTVFQQASGRLMCAVGSDLGVFMSPYDDPRGWFRVYFFLIPFSSFLLHANVMIFRLFKHIGLLRLRCMRNSTFCFLSQTRLCIRTILTPYALQMVGPSRRKTLIDEHRRSWLGAK